MEKNAMKTTKILSLLLALIMAVSCFAACGGDGSEGAKDPVVTDAPDTDAPENPGSTSATDTANRADVKDTVPKLDFSNAKDNEVTFFVRSDREMFLNEMDVEKTVNDTLTDAVYYRNATVEKRLGVEINQIATAYSSSGWDQSLRNAVLTKSGDYDAAAIYASAGSALAVEGLYYNVLDIPHINLDKPWWNKSIIEETTLFDTVYFLAGDIAISEIGFGVTLFYNKNIFNELYSTTGDNLYTLVENDEWTVDKMYEYVAGAWEDRNSDGIINIGDQLGLTYANSAGDGAMDAWVAAMGIDITTMIDGYPELTFYNEHTVDAFEKLKWLHLENEGTYVGASGEFFDEFMAGNQLFVRAFISSGQTFRNMTDEYGVLPLPKYDKAQEDYRTLAANISSLVVVLSSATDLDMIGATLELMAAESYKQVVPAYYDTVLKGKYSDAPEDAAMYDLIVNSLTYNFGFCFSTHSLEGIGSLFRVLDTDIAQKYDANKVKYQTGLDELIDKLDDAAFNLSMNK